MDPSITPSFTFHEAVEATCAILEASFKECHYDRFAVHTILQGLIPSSDTGTELFHRAEQTLGGNARMHPKRTEEGYLSADGTEGEEEEEEEEEDSAPSYPQTVPCKEGLHRCSLLALSVAPTTPPNIIPQFYHVFGLFPDRPSQLLFILPYLSRCAAQCVLSEDISESKALIAVSLFNALIKLSGETQIEAEIGWFVNRLCTIATSPCRKHSRSEHSVASFIGLNIGLKLKGKSQKKRSSVLLEGRGKVYKVRCISVDPYRLMVDCCVKTVQCTCNSIAMVRRAVVVAIRNALSRSFEGSSLWLDAALLSAIPSHPWGACLSPDHLTPHQTQYTSRKEETAYMASHFAVLSAAGGVCTKETVSAVLGADECFAVLLGLCVGGKGGGGGGGGATLDPQTLLSILLELLGEAPLVELLCDCMATLSITPGVVLRFLLAVLKGGGGGGGGGSSQAPFFRQLHKMLAGYHTLDMVPFNPTPLLRRISSVYP